MTAQPVSAPLLKDQINATLVRQIGHSCVRHYPQFPLEMFCQQTLNETFAQRELKARIRWVATQIYLHLALPFASACQVLKPVSTEFSGLAGFIFGDIVEQFGLDDAATALDALAHFTCYSTSEFAIRPFLTRYPELTLGQMQQWARSDNHHLRRLASEGSRPRLPWGQALPQYKQDPTPLLPILELLRQDDSDYVRRSVANHLNDISKDQPDLALAICQRWYGSHPYTNWIVKHALRGLLKQRHAAALAIFDYQPADLTLDLTLTSTELQLGDTLQFQLKLRQASGLTQKIRLEYAIDFAGKQGQPRHKVFQWLERLISEPELQLKRSYVFKDLTTRKHYAGEHQLHIIVNGQILQSMRFQLRAEPSMLAFNRSYTQSH